MSLIGIRRERKAQSGGPAKPPRLWKQIVAFVLIVYLIWHLSQLF
jgi:hypothetical protein